MDKVAIGAEELDLHAFGGGLKGAIELLKGVLDAFLEGVVAGLDDGRVRDGGAKQFGDGGIGG